MSNYNADDVRTAAAVAGEVEKERQSGIIDWRYVKGLPGLLKGLQAVLSLIAYICVETSQVMCVNADMKETHAATFSFFKFVTLFAFATVMILYGIRLFKLQTRIFRCSCINWPLIELCYYGGLIIFYLFADLFCSLHACHSSQKAGAAFGWFALAAFAVDLFFAIRTFQQSRKSPDMKSSPLPDDSDQRY